MSQLKKIIKVYKESFNNKEEFVYNKDLDQCKNIDEIKFIIVGDNPGIKEKRSK
jgi:hypothetical protein